VRYLPFRERRFWLVAALLTVGIELVTVVARLIAGQSAAEFNRSVDPPLILKVHHPLYAVPVIAVGLLVRGPRLSRALWALVIALVASDALHHLVVLPIWVGNTGWHWP
jgi:hypothetical protein